MGRKPEVLIFEPFFVRDSSAGGSNMVEAGEEFVDVADNIINSKVQGQGGIHSGSTQRWNSRMLMYEFL